ncbi:MAG: hypothetical protein K6A40_04725 [Solobacterium sp.]|nr:hypothetical protein [Solobacterium sp.]
MEIWNSRSLDNNQRFLKALLCSLAAAVVLGIAYGMLHSILRIEASIIYIGIGWCIGQVVKKTGRGVHKRFAVLGAVMTLLAILIGDTCSMYGLMPGLKMLMRPLLWPSVIIHWMRIYLSANINALLSLLFRAAGIWFGYSESILF